MAGQFERRKVPLRGSSLWNPIIAVVMALLLSLPARAESPPLTPAALLEAEPGTVPAAALIDLARLHRTASGQTILASDLLVEIDSIGQVTTTYHRIATIDSARAASAWSRPEFGWSPWFQARPEVELRLVAPDGKERRVHGSTLSESVDAGATGTMLTDVHRLHADLGDVPVGSVYEEWVRERETTPFSTIGRSGRLRIGDTVPVVALRIRVEAPATVPLRVGVRNHTGKVESRTRGDRQTHEIRTGSLPAFTSEPLAPPDDPGVPVLSWSTTPGWQALAASYAEIVESRLAGARFPEVVARARGPQSTQAEVIGRLAFVASSMRYLALEFGRGAIIPAPPQTTFDRGFGDCKDKSTLLVALLREAGIEADVALLRAGAAEDVDPDFPGLDLFNHAIVRVRTDPEVWIDPTAELAGPGELPAGDQGRWALVADPRETALVRTPRTPGHLGFRTEIGPGADGEWRSHRTVEASGWVAAEFRGAFRIPAGEGEEALTRTVRDVFGEAAEHIEVHDPFDTLHPFRASWEVGSATVDAETVDVNARIATLLVPDSGFGGPLGPRSPVQIPPYVADVEWVIRAGPNHEPAADGVDSTERVGSVVARWSHERRDDGALAVRYHLNLGEGRYAQSDAPSVGALLGAERSRTIQLRSGSDRLLAEGAVVEALRAAAATVRDQPRDPNARASLGRVLVDAGFTDAGRTLADEALADAPTDAHVLRTHIAAWGGVLPAGGGEARKRVLADLESLREIVPEAPDLALALATLRATGNDGRRYGPGADIDGALAMLRADHERSPTSESALRLADGYLWVARPEAIFPLEETLTAWEEKAIRVARIALSDGPDAALAAAGGITDDGAESTVRHAAQHLVRARHYDLAAGIVEHFATTADMAELAGQIRKIHRVEARQLRPDHPADLLFALAREGRVGEALSPWRDPRLVEALVDVDDLPEPVLVDVLTSHASAETDGDPGRGWRVRYRIPGAATDAALTWYAVREGAIITPVVRGGDLPGIARAALDRVGPGPAGATWLGWLAAELPFDHPAQPLLLSATSTEQARIALAAVLATDDPTFALPILLAAPPGAATLRGLAEAATLQGDGATLAVAAGRATTVPDLTSEAHRWRILGALLDSDVPTADRAARAWARTAPQAIESVAWVAVVREFAGDRVGAMRILKRAIADWPDNSLLSIRLAWLSALDPGTRGAVPPLVRIASGQSEFGFTGAVSATAGHGIPGPHAARAVAALAEAGEVDAAWGAWRAAGHPLGEPAWKLTAASVLASSGLDTLARGVLQGVSAAAPPEGPLSPQALAHARAQGAP